MSKYNYYYLASMAMLLLLYLLLFCSLVLSFCFYNRFVKILPFVILCSMLHLQYNCYLYYHCHYYSSITIRSFLYLILFLYGSRQIIADFIFRYFLVYCLTMSMLYLLFSTVLPLLLRSCPLDHLINYSVRTFS